MPKTQKTDADRRTAARRNTRRRRDTAVRRKRKRTAARKKARQSRAISILWSVAFVLFALILAITAVQLTPILRDIWNRPPATPPDWVDVQLIEVNGKARRGERLDGVHDIVIHYVGNPGTTAQENRDFFNQPDTDVSAHFLVGLEGEVIQCVPLDEKSSASNERNRDTISIEVCHPGADGAFNDKTYRSLVRLTAWLCKAYRLDREHVIRHYDVTGKLCPLYYVEHPDAWEGFLEDVDRNQ